MDRFKNIRRTLVISLVAALLISTASHPDISVSENQCFLFPQFTSAASASRERPSNEEKEDEITYAFGLIELLQKLNLKK